MAPENTVFISGIGCCGRFPITWTPTGSTGSTAARPRSRRGVATATPICTVWVVTGDGDALSIGGNHLIHALRRNVNLKILMFNNQIYGLTKGQYSPTSEVGKVTKSTPFGSVDRPFDPVALALGAEADVRRAHDRHRPQAPDRGAPPAAAHPGAAFVEIYQNCNVFNDGAFDLLRDKTDGPHNQIRLVHGEPIVFDGGTRCVRLAANGRLEIADVADTDPTQIITHDVHGPPSLAFTLAHLSQGPTEPTCIGVFREVQRATYGEAVHDQIARARERSGDGDLEALLTGGDTWTV